jgi:hypothetical protein
MAVIYRISSTPNTGSSYILGSALSYTQLDGNFAYLLTNMSGSQITITGNTNIVNGNLTVANGVTASLQGTASYALFAQTASYFSGSITNAISSSYALSSSYAVTASYFSGSITNAVSSSYALTASYALNGGGSTTGSFTGSFTGSLFGTASYALTASYFSGSITNAISSSYALSSSHADLANIQYVTNSGNLALGQIQVLDYSDSVATTYVNGLLTFVFGTPATPSTLAASISGFATDRFNQVTDNYTVNGSWSNGGYTLISASLYEGGTFLTGITDSGTSLSYNTTTSGSHTYRLAYTASSPLDNSIYLASITTTGTLNKINPGNPTISATPVVQLGAASNQIEQGATGSITFTSASGAANGWIFNYESTNIQTPYTITGSLTGSTSVAITPTAYYSSSGVGGSDNNPPLNTTTTSTTTYTKVRSLRSGATLTSSYSQNDLEQLANWDTTLGGTVGTIKKGTLNPIGQTVVINWTGSLYQYIVYDSSYPNLTAINSSGFNVSASFTLTTTGSYKVYRTTALQAGYGGTTVTYTLA